MFKNMTLVNSCPLCESNNIFYKFLVNSYPVCGCKDCSHLFINPQSMNEFGDVKHSFNSDKLMNILKSELEFNGSQKFKALIIGAPLLNNNDFKSTTIKGSDIISYIENEPENENKYDFCILNNTLDYSNSPNVLLQRVHKTMKKNGMLLFYVPVLDSKSAKSLKQNWPVFISKRLHFFSTATITNILCKCGYEQIEIIPANDDGVFISCRTGILRNERLLSIIIPVYNEEKTIRKLLISVMNKHLEGLEKEIIIVESNSKDSTRPIVESFVKEHPEVKLIFEEKPCGKGHAVRNGFREATGDFIAIQDGDLEYDINDYDQLIIPLVNYRRAFVLGSRHTGDWKLRDFGKEKKVTATYMNLGHLFFSALINFGCGVKLKDPFTMYKLFRRECLYGLEFDANRFEIDWEIVIKLIRKGYIPEEIPINYQARGFNQGKKVALLKDPIIWMISFLKYRYFYKMHVKSK